jgi:DNA gyrase subunit A
VKGINLSPGDEVVGMVVLSRPDTTLLVVTEGGMGKRTDVGAYRSQQRGGKGVINIKTTPKTGKVMAIKSVVDQDELMVITRNGVVNRQRVSEIRAIGRATQGVRLVNLDADDQVRDVARVIAEEGARENGVPLESSELLVGGDDDVASSGEVRAGPEAGTSEKLQGGPEEEGAKDGGAGGGAGNEDVDGGGVGEVLGDGPEEGR